MSGCSGSPKCARWASDYLGYCLCSTNDAISLALGLVSVFSWAVAEIPQIFTNSTKSTHGLSFALLCTWILGDFFNLFGCLLEPATLPTQFYMAALYTMTTLTLASQTINYDHIYHRLKCNKPFHKVVKTDQREKEGEYIGYHNSDGYGLEQSSSMSHNSATMSSPFPLPAMPRSQSTEQDSFYTSARSLSTSHSPIRSFVATCGASVAADAKDSVEEPLLGGSLPTMPVLLSKSKSKSKSNTKNLFCIVPAITFIFGTLNFSYTRDTRPSVAIILSSRKLLQVNVEQNIKSGASGHIGTYLGWAMASICIGGRLPQICLNMRRGHVEGLNPLMFMFALLGNVTYVASILVSSLEWSRIRPNLPWLVDSGGCALLDTFILCQFIYFQYRQSNAREIKHGEAH